jgi:hypothetical protein
MRAVVLPDFEAAWWPIRMETVPGSGEAISVAVVVRATSGQSQVRQLISPPIIAGLFGEASKGIASMITTTVVRLQDQLNSGLRVEELHMPFGGFSLADKRECVANDINEVFDLAFRFSSAFGQSNYGVRQEVKTASKKAFDEWASRIRENILQRDFRQIIRTPIPEEFNVRLKLASKPVKVGFLRHTYAANFGVMRPGSTSGDTRSLKVKVFDLEAIRREQLHPIENAEVLVGCPAEDQLSCFSNRERDTYLNSMEFIEKEAKARSVNVLRFSTPIAAANHLVELLAA